MLRRATFYSLVLFLFLFSLNPSTANAIVVDQVIAVIDGEPYTLSDFKEYARLKMRRDFPSGDLNHIEKEDQEVLEQFITEKLLNEEVKLSGIRISEKDVDRYIGKIQQGNRISQEELKEALLREGMTMEKYRVMIRAEIEKSEIINRQVRKKVNVTPEDVERYYLSNRKKYSTEERVRLGHILFPLPEGAPPEKEKESRLKAMEISDRGNAGEDFSKLAEQYSEGVASNGGDIGWVTRGSLLKEIEEVAFNQLSVGKISQPLRTTLGYQIIKLQEREEEGFVPLVKVEKEIKAELYSKVMEEKFQKWLKTDLRRKHQVDVKLPGVVFRPEEAKEETLNSLMVSTSRDRTEKERGFFSYLNPFSYIVNETPIEGEDAEGELSGEKIVSIFGVPLFTTSSSEDLPEDPFALGGGSEKPSQEPEPEDSEGFFSSVWGSLNPF